MLPAKSSPATKPQPSPPPPTPIRWATLIMLGLCLLMAVVIAAWFSGQTQVTRLFEQLAALQANPPRWVQAPMVAGRYLLAPTVFLSLVAWAITKISSKPKTWSRVVVVAILLSLLGRYLSWRIFSTLNLSTPLSGTFSLLLLAMELVGLTGSCIQLMLLLRMSDRRPQADQLQPDVLAGRYLPSVDVFIPTYNEPDFILRRTIMGCQALEYPRKTVYFLDDTRRPSFRALAQELLFQYLTRPDNRHAKAGNLNHAIAHTQSELIVSFDADFVPTRNFLLRTVGFFQDPQVALVQTPQSFYNPDPIARNLGLEGILTPDEEVFYRQIQPMRDGVGGVVCSGTSFVVRRQALEATGGFVTESLSEDYFTAVRLAADGNKVIYLDEKLSAGLAAETIAAHVIQRVRWAQGTLQAFFIESNPLTIPGLTLIQRLAHLEGLLHWFSSIPRIVFLFMPFVYTFFRVIPIQASTEEVMYFFLPYYAVQLTVFSWLNHRSRSAILSDVYGLVMVFPLARTVFQAFLAPFDKGFNVTPKGIHRDRFAFNWQLAWPLLFTFTLTVISLWRNLAWALADSSSNLGLKGLALGWIWSLYNLLMLAIALLILLDVPNPDGQIWLAYKRVAELVMTVTTDSEKSQVISVWGMTQSMSETGALVSFVQPAMWTINSETVVAVTLNVAEESLALPGRLTQIQTNNQAMTAKIEFGPLSLTQQRQLVELLFCRPGQWKRWNSPGELRSLLILLQVLLWPRFLTGSARVNPLPTA
ncbi:MAG: glycosyltransferase [Leptolyngbyaceae cyanobacterium]